METNNKAMSLILSLMGILLMPILGCNQKTTNEVVIYVSTDQVFSEPILRDFEKDTGIKVKAVYDTEETKSTGAMNRLIAEKRNPQADVYWANEPLRAVVLKQKGISISYFSTQYRDIPVAFKDSQGYWTGFSARARVFLVGINGEGPTSILDYANEKWKNRAVIANPLFGTTTAWVSALFTLWGDEKARAFMERMKMNGVKISTSNGESTTLVVNGEFSFGLVDTDDALTSIRNGKPVRMTYPDQQEGDMGCLVLPNAAVLIKGGPNPENGKKLIDYLLSPQTEQKLAFSAGQIPLHQGVEVPPQVNRIEAIKVMEVNFETMALKLLEIQPYLKEWVGY